MSNSSRPHGLQPTRFLCPWDFPGKSAGVACHCLLPVSNKSGPFKYFPLVADKMLGFLSRGHWRGTAGRKCSYFSGLNWQALQNPESPPHTYPAFSAQAASPTLGSCSMGGCSRVQPPQPPKEGLPPFSSCSTHWPAETLSGML